jgi:hypothetical protein
MREDYPAADTVLDKKPQTIRGWILNYNLNSQKIYK